MQDKARKHSKISEITFYVGLFLFIFAIVIFISLAAKNAFGQTSSVINALIGVASASIVLGVGFLATSGVFFWLVKKSRAMPEAKTRSSASKAPLVSVAANTEDNLNPVVNTSLNTNGLQQVKVSPTLTGRPSAQPVRPNPAVAARPMAQPVRPNPTMPARPMAQPARPNPAVNGRPSPAVLRPTPTRPTVISQRPNATYSRPTGSYSAK